MFLPIPNYPPVVNHAPARAYYFILPICARKEKEKREKKSRKGKVFENDKPSFISTFLFQPTPAV